MLDWERFRKNRDVECDRKIIRESVKYHNECWRKRNNKLSDEQFQKQKLMKRYEEV